MGTTNSVYFILRVWQYRDTCVKSPHPKFVLLWEMFQIGTFFSGKIFKSKEKVISSKYRFANISSYLCCNRRKCVRCSYGIMNNAFGFVVEKVTPERTSGNNIWGKDFRYAILIFSKSVQGITVVNIRCSKPIWGWRNTFP